MICQVVYSQKVLQAVRTDAAFEIDGHLDESAWDNAIDASQFTTWQPNPGLSPNKDATIKFLYDDEALYIGAFMEEVGPDSVMQEITQRDRVGNTDWFGVLIDPYESGNNAFEFITMATNTQFDAKIVENQGEDTDWDAVWFSGTQILENGWSLEMKIPYSAIRFPKKEEQIWKINFIKYQARTAEKSVWNEIDPLGTFFLTQSGIVEGINNIKPPLRLSISPYLSVYAQNNYDRLTSPKSSTGYSYNGGLDVKYGINDAFTLDMTLIPDFGQVQSDDNIVNLSPFEVRFTENRPFFTEGVEIFNKGDLFYSRRVGGTPLRMYEVEDQLAENEEIVDNPRETQLYNASKISGRTKSGLGVGVFNAVAGETNAIIENNETGDTRRFRTSPLTNYNVFVLDQNLKNNSTISLVNASTVRTGSQFYDANVTTGMFDLRDKKQRVSVSGNLAVSQIFNEGMSPELGYRYEFGIDKLLGNFNYGLWHETKTNDFNPNDLGFNTRTNLHEYGAWASYSLVNEFWKYFNRANFWFNYNHVFLNEPRVHQGTYINLGFWTQTKSQWNFNGWFNVIPKDDDYFEPRMEGYFEDVPLNYNGGVWVGTDNRKKFRLSGTLVAFNVAQKGWNGQGVYLTPRYRFNNKLTSSLSMEYHQINNDKGWVGFGDKDEILYGTRDRLIIVNVLNTEYTISDKMGLTFRLRHYWTKVLYEGFMELNKQGKFNDTVYEGDHDFNFDQFNIDLNYRWRFAPGSDLFINWKNNIAGGYLSPNQELLELSYFNGLEGLRNLPQENSISARLVYYLDYQQVSQYAKRIN